MQAENNLNFHNTKPTVWLKKENEPKNLTITDITSKDNFIIVNPEEIGRQISHIYEKISQILTIYEYVKLFNFYIAFIAYKNRWTFERNLLQIKPKIFADIVCKLREGAYTKWSLCRNVSGKLWLLQLEDVVALFARTRPREDTLVNESEAAARRLEFGVRRRIVL